MNLISTFHDWLQVRHNRHVIQHIKDEMAASLVEMMKQYTPAELEAAILEQPADQQEALRQELVERGILPKTRRNG